MAYPFFQIMDAPVGARAMVLDVSKFHRRTPIAPAHKHRFVVQGRVGDFYIQHCCPFGATASESNSGNMTAAIIALWDAFGFGPSSKWSDDVTSLQFPLSGSGTEDDPFVYGWSRQDMISATASTGIPWHEDKGQDFAPSFLYVGFSWNIDSRIVSLPEEKRFRYLYRCDVFLALVESGEAVNEKRLLELHGVLCHITFVIQLGRSHLPSISNFITRFNDYPEGKCLRPPPSVKTDVNWWFKTLSSPNLSRSLAPLGEPLDLKISVDASTSWGIGIAWGERWDAWKVCEGWKGPYRDIGWLECLAIELLVLHIEADGRHDCIIKVDSDNQGIIGAHEKGRSRNVEVNYSIRRFMNILDSLHVFLDISYIESEKNPADRLSRGKLGPPDLRIESSIELPEELVPYLTHA